MKRLLSILCMTIPSFLFTYGQAPACDGQRYIEEVFTDLTETFDVKYGENITVTGATKELMVDVFEPAGDVEVKRPLLLLIHGGSFVFGDKSDLHDICRSYARRGYVAATMSYRLFDGPIVPLPDSIALVEVVVQSVEDASAALRYFKDNAVNDNTFGIDPDQIVIGGISAGGITSVQVAYMDDNDEIPDFMALNIDDVYGLAGNSNDLTDINTDVIGVLNFSGAIYNTAWMDADDEPIYSVHDDGDNVVPYGVGYAAPFFGIPIVSLQGSEAVHGKAIELGINSELVTIENSLAHVSYFNNLSSDIAQEVLLGSSTFVENLVCNDPSSVEELSALMNTTAYPNPSDSEILIEWSADLKDARLLVFDQLGKLVIEKEVSGFSTTVSKENIGTGFFIAKIEAADVNIDAIQLLFR